MKRIITQQQKEQLFALLRSGLWGTIPDASLFSNCSWETVITLASEHAVIGIVADGISLLPKELQPPMSLKMRVIAAVSATEKNYYEILRTFEHITDEYRRMGVETLLMKGLSISSRYPIPEHRASGDIDLYILSGLSEADRWARDNGTDIEDFYAKHLSFNWHGTTIENHKTLCHFHSKEINRRFSRIVDNELSLHSQLPIRDIGGTVARELPTTLYAFFLLCHKAEHFIEDGLGLRQICDWAVFLNSVPATRQADVTEPVDRHKFCSWLSTMELEQLANVFGQICVDNLGLAEEKLPFTLNRNSRNYELITWQIFHGGNFGKNFYKYKNRKDLSRYTKLLRTLFIKVPRYTRLYSLWRREMRACYISVCKRGVRRLFS